MELYWPGEDDYEQKTEARYVTLALLFDFPLRCSYIIDKLRKPTEKSVMKLQFLLPTVYIHILCNLLSKVFASAAKSPMELPLTLSNCYGPQLLRKHIKTLFRMHPPIEYR
jgi:hypothetical protein